VETQTVTIAAAQNPDILDCTTPTLLNSIDCDWHWTAASRPVSSFTIDGVAYPSATADYDPPGSRPCGSEPNGAIWSSATAGLPSTGPCPPGYSGTQSCPTLIVNQYTCSAGASVLSNTGMQTGIICTGCSLLPTSAPPPSACAAGGYAGDVVFVLDESASVIASDFLSAKTFFNDVVTGINLTSSSQVAVITFNTTPTQAGFGVRYQSPVLVGTNTSAINATLNKFVDTGGGTDIYTAMQTAANLLVGVGMTRTPKTIVLISDGQHNEAAPLPRGRYSVRGNPHCHRWNYGFELLHSHRRRPISPWPGCARWAHGRRERNECLHLDQLRVSVSGGERFGSRALRRSRCALTTRADHLAGSPNPPHSAG
jgi:hypothetical protein